MKMSYLLTQQGETKHTGSSTYWLIPQMAATVRAGAGPGGSKKLLQRSHTGAEAQALGSALIPFPD